MSKHFERFTVHSRRVLELAQEEAQRYNHNDIGAEHLLLGLLREQDGIAAKVLASLGVERGIVRTAVEVLGSRGADTVSQELRLSASAEKALELSVAEARRWNQGYIGTEHILLGLVRDVEGAAAAILEGFGVSLRKVQRQVRHELSLAASEGRNEIQIRELRAKLINSLIRSRNELMQAIDGLSDSQLVEATPNGPSVREHMMQVAYMDEVRTNEIGRVSQGWKAAHYDASQDQIHAWSLMVRDLRSGLTVSQVRWELQFFRSRMIESISRASEVALDKSNYGEIGLDGADDERERAVIIRRWRSAMGY